MTRIKEWAIGKLDGWLRKLGYIRNRDHYKAVTEFMQRGGLSRLVTATLSGETLVWEETKETLTFKWVIDPTKGRAAKIHANIMEQNSFLENLEKHGRSGES